MVGIIVGLLAVIAGLIGTVALVIPRASKNATTAETVAMLKTQNDSYRNEVRDTERRAKEDVEIVRREVVGLAAQVELLRSDFADQVAGRVANNGLAEQVAERVAEKLRA